jgi:uncharacterized membrane protein
MKHWFKNTARGLCMGVADTIPGVSGGTIALILGIYERFVDATSGIGPQMLAALFKAELWRRMWRGLKDPSALGDDAIGKHAERILFLTFLVLGIGTAIAIGARFIPDLLLKYPSQMNGFFLGLVLASCVIPYRMLKRRGLTQVFAFILFAIGTYLFVGLPIDQSQQAHGTLTVHFPAPTTAPLTITPWQEQNVFSTDYFGGKQPTREIGFVPTRHIDVPVGSSAVDVPLRAKLAGAVANIPVSDIKVSTGLPAGVTFSATHPMSGGSDPALWYIFIAGVLAISAMVLPGISGSFVLLMLGLYHYILFNLRLLLYEQDTNALPIIATFMLSLIIGIATFSRFLKWLFARYHDVTLAALIGIMLGSVRELWPFKTVDAFGEAENSLPAAVDSTFIVTVVCVLVGGVLVLGLEKIGAKLSQQTSSS